MIVFLIAGFASVMQMAKELYPEIKIPTLIVTTVYIGASAEDVENTVTKVLENELIGSVKQVDEITSTSSEGVSSIVITLKENAEAEKIKDDVTDIIKKAKNSLPSDVEEPTVIKPSFSEQPIYVFALSSNKALSSLYKLADEIEDKIKKVNGVSEVSVSGVGERQITVLLNEKKLLQYDISPQQVAGAISSAKNVFPVGSINFDNTSLSVLYESSVNKAESLENIVVKDSGDSFVTVKDLAVQIEDGLEEFETISRISNDNLHQQQSVIFSVTKQDGGNIMTLTDNIKKAVDEFAENSGEELNFVEVMNSGNDIRTQLSDLLSSGFQTILIVVLVVGFFVGTVEAIIAALSIPLTFMVSFVMMSYLGGTINFMSLFSLILVIGILIDSTIVIVEGIAERAHKKMGLKESAKDTLETFSKPVIAGTLTTIAVFLPLLTLSGIVGQFIGAIPKTIVIVLFVSLFVALAFIPVLSIAFYKLNIKESKKITEKREKVFHFIENWYRNAIDKMLHTQKIRKSIRRWSYVLFFGTIAMVVAGIIPSAFFPPDDYERIYLNYSEKVNTDLETTSENLKEVEEVIKNAPHVVAFTTTVGESSAFSGNGSSKSSEKANITINIVDDKKSPETLKYLEDKLADLNSKADVEVFKPESGPPTGKPIEVKLISEDIEKLEVYAQKVFEVLEKIDGVKNASQGFDLGIKKIAIEPYEYKLAQKGLTSSDLSAYLRSNVFGVVATSLNLQEGSVDVYVKTDLNGDSKSHVESNDVNVDAIKNLSIKTQKGTVALGSLVDIKIKPDRRSISHEEGNRIITVTSEIADGFNTGDIQTKLNEKLEEIDFEKAGVKISSGGEAEASSESGQELMFSLIYGLLLMVLVLMWQFNSFKDTYFILSVIPMGLAGVLLGLFITGKDFSFTAMLGFIALVGIVVNNSIILIDTFNSLKAKGDKDLFEVILEGTFSRLRPILITTMTTVLGMIPLVFVSPMWAPFAIALIFGLSFTTFMTLFLVPMRYYRANRTKEDKEKEKEDNKKAKLEKKEERRERKENKKRKNKR